MIARSEQFVLEHAKQLAQFRAAPISSSFDPNRPWETVIRAVALDRAFWDKTLEKPALRRELQGNRSTPAFQQASSEGGGSGSGNKRAGDDYPAPPAGKKGA